MSRVLQEMLETREQSAFSAGIQKGIQKGMQTGIYAERNRIVTRMLKKGGSSLCNIAELASIPLSEVILIKDCLEQAQDAGETVLNRRSKAIRYKTHPISD